MQLFISCCRTEDAQQRLFEAIMSVALFIVGDSPSTEAFGCSQCGPSQQLLSFQDTTQTLKLVVHCQHTHAWG